MTLTHETRTGARPLDPAARAVVITSDAHCGPRLDEDLRPYCPPEHLGAFDAFAVKAAERRQLGGIGGPTDGMDREKVRGGPLRNTLFEGGWDMESRLRDMDRDGIAGEIVFHGLNQGRVDPIPFANGVFDGIASGDDAELVAVGKRIYNEWLADFVSLEPERHAGLAQLPMWDIARSVDEVRWAHEHGLRGVNFTRLQPGIVPYNHPDWEPFWAVCEELGMTLTTHAQSEGTASFDFYQGEGSHLIGVLDVVGYAVRKSAHHLVLGRVFDRHPGLQLVFTEQPGRWFTPLFEEMDDIYAGLYLAMVGDNPAGYQLDRGMPSEYTHHLFIGSTCLSHDEALDAVEHGYASQVMWGSDYPHPEGASQYPRYDDEPAMARLAMRDTFAGVGTEPTAKMLGTNAAAAYGFDLDALQEVADRIEAPTFAELDEPLEEVPGPNRMQRGAWYAFRRHGAWH